MATAGEKSPLEEYLDDLWETCDFPRPRQPSNNMKAARLRATKENEVKQRDEDLENGSNDQYVDQLDPAHYRSVTEEIRKIRGERSSDRNIEWIINRSVAKSNDAPKTPESPVKMQLVKDLSPTNVDTPRYVLHMPTEPQIDVQSLRDFPELK